jgi:hypothetical protein
LKRVKIEDITGLHDKEAGKGRKRSVLAVDCIDYTIFK